MEDSGKAHIHFSSECFNGVWALLEKTDRTPAEDELMCEMSHASMFHWLNREDLTSQNRSIGYWQLSRVYSVLNKGPQAKQYAQQCLDASDSLAPFFLGYAHEAMARASLVCSDSETFSSHLDIAKSLCEKVTDPQDQAALNKDLMALGS